MCLGSRTLNDDRSIFNFILSIQDQTLEMVFMDQTDLHIQPKMSFRHLMRMGPNIVLCPFLIRDYTVGQKGLKLPTMKSENARFNSAVDNLPNPSQYVIFQ